MVCPFHHMTIVVNFLCHKSTHTTYSQPGVSVGVETKRWTCMLGLPIDLLFELSMLIAVH